MKLEMERYLLAKSTYRIGLYLWLGGGRQGRIIRGQSVKKFHENFLLLPSSLYLCLLISSSNWDGKNSWQHLFRRIYTVNIMKFWTPLLMMFLCMVLLSVLGRVKERYNRWWGWIEDQKCMTGLCLFLDKWGSIVPNTSYPGLTSLDHLLEHLCIDTFQ